MAKPPLEFMAKHKIDSDEVWEVRAGAFAIKHAALERVAAENNIQFDEPVMIEFDTAQKFAVIRIMGRIPSNGASPARCEWSFGEAAPYNNKNSYPFAMAEKRAKDRVTLKLLNAHGTIYSDAEADEFIQGQGDGKPTTLPKKDARDIYSKMQREIRECLSREQLKLWMDANKSRIQILAEDWQDHLRLQCQEMMLDLQNREAA